MDVRTRNRVVGQHRYCVNCLAKSHDLRACASLNTCQKCGSYHHTLLHPGIRTRIYKKRTNIDRSPSSTVSKQRSSSIKPKRSSKHHVLSRHQPPATSRQATKQVATSQPAAQRAPDQHIISEAIRSLAEVLCIHPTNSAPGGRNV